MINGNIPDLEILIPDDTKESAELIYPTTYSSVSNISSQMIRDLDSEKPPPASLPHLRDVDLPVIPADTPNNFFAEYFLY